MSKKIQRTRKNQKKRQNKRTTRARSTRVRRGGAVEMPIGSVIPYSNLEEDVQRQIISTRIQP